MQRFFVGQSSEKAYFLASFGLREARPLDLYYGQYTTEQEQQRGIGELHSKD